MAIQTGPVYLQGNYGNICAYWSNGQWLFRQRSTLTGKRVKTSPRFRNTMLYAGLLKRGSMIASAIYAALPAHWKQFWMYRSFVGEAMRMLKEGKKDEEVLAVLWTVYVAEFDAAYREAEVFLHRWAEPTRISSAGTTCAALNTLRAPLKRLIVLTDGRIAGGRRFLRRQRYQRRMGAPAPA